MIPLPGPPGAVWDRLAERSGNVFLTRDFAECWWQAYDAPGRPVVLQDDDADPSVVLALHVSSRPLRQVRFIGHGPADELGPVCGPEAHPAAAELLRQGLRRLGHDVVLLQDVPVEHGWPKRVTGRVVHGVSSPTVALGVADWDAFLAGRSKNFREQARRRERKLHKAFDVTVRVSTAVTLEADLDALFALHRLRWGQDAAFATGQQARLVRAFCGRALAAQRLRLSVLELDGAPVAALLGLRFAGVHSFWQSGRDPGFDEHSIGSVLLLDAVRAAVEDGAREYRLLRGDEPYKARLADGDRPVETVAVPRGMLGGAAVRAAQWRRRRATRVL